MAPKFVPGSLGWLALAIPTLRGGIHAVFDEDALDRVAAELVTEVAERATDPRVDQLGFSVAN